MFRTGSAPCGCRSLKRKRRCVCASRPGSTRPALSRRSQVCSAGRQCSGSKRTPLHPVMQADRDGPRARARARATAHCVAALHSVPAVMYGRAPHCGAFLSGNCSGGRRVRVRTQGRGIWPQPTRRGHPRRKIATPLRSTEYSPRPAVGADAG
jgi:hypothetical protein